MADTKQLGSGSRTLGFGCWPEDQQEEDEIYIRLGDVSKCTHPPLRILAAEIAEVYSLQYPGCWMADLVKDFYIDSALAFKTADDM